MALKLLGNTNRGLAFIVSAPAGTGKTTLVQMLTTEFPCVVANISYTTRQPRGDEVNGSDYHFLSVSEFEEKIAAGDFLEHVLLYGNHYGTSRKWIESQLDLGKHVVLVIDTQGAALLRKKFPAVAIFVRPPSVIELKRRLEVRGTESLEIIEARLELAEDELRAVKYYDYIIINDDLKIAYEAFRSVFIAEEHRVMIGG
ncbi:MAG: guanylate kinase [Parachlamydiaceae bacterium]|nr:guanylate kinase [Parachlamydiaceae bacterium]